MLADCIHLRSNGCYSGPVLRRRLFLRTRCVIISLVCQIRRKGIYRILSHRFRIGIHYSMFAEFKVE